MNEFTLDLRKFANEELSFLYHFLNENETKNVCHAMLWLDYYNLIPIDLYLTFQLINVNR